MNSHPTNRNPQDMYPRFQMAPLALRLFFIFSTAITLFSMLWMFLPKATRAAIVPITGWSMGNGYTFALFFTVVLIFAPHPKIQKRKIRFAIVLLMAFDLAISAINFGFRYNAENFGNPYLTVSILQPIWTVLIPLCWIQVLMSRKVTEYCKK